MTHALPLRQIVVGVDGSTARQMPRCWSWEPPGPGGSRGSRPWPWARGGPRACLRLAHCPVVVAPDGPPASQGAGRRRGTMARSGGRLSGLSFRMPVPLG